MKKDIREIIMDFPGQFAKGIYSAENISVRGRFDSVLVCGMGGSAWPAEILRDWLNPVFPFYVNKTYGLPPQIGKKCLAIICSYSGNTEETLSCYKEAQKKGYSVVGLTTGGKLKELCKKSGHPLAVMPDDVPAPRLGCGYTIGGLAKILEKSGLISGKTGEMAAIAAKINSGWLEKEGKKLAEKISGRIPIIYAADRFRTLPYIWKIKLNETSKIPAFSNYFPELNHNELSAYAKKSKAFMVMILMDTDDLPRIQKRMLLTLEIIKKSGAGAEIISLPGKTSLEKITNGILLADWASYWLALKTKTDPFSIKLQEEIKKRLKK